MFCLAVHQLTLISVFFLHGEDERKIAFLTVSGHAPALGKPRSVPTAEPTRHPMGHGPDVGEGEVLPPNWPLSVLR